MQLIEYDDSPYVIGVEANGTKSLEPCKWHRGQREALASRSPITLVLAGTQSGKTALGPWWLMREILRGGPGDYLVAGPTHPTLNLNAIPAFERLFCSTLKWGELIGQKCFYMHDKVARDIFGKRYRPGYQTRVIFGHAMRPSSLESATIIAAWLDECGQPEFKLGSWEAIQRRFSTTGMRVLMTTTPYTWGWLKSNIYDRADGKEITVINFNSLENPAFKKEEYYRAKNSGMQAWKFEMFYHGSFQHPAGRIYDCFDRAKHTMARQRIPDHWRRAWGQDFGDVNMATIYLGAEKDDQDKETGRYFAYRTYHAGKKLLSSHVEHMLAAPEGMERQGESNNVAPDVLGAEPGKPSVSYGGAPSEDHWRREFGNNGLPIRLPHEDDVGVQIQRTYEMINTGRLLFMDDLTHVIDDLESYSYEVDDQGNPIDGKIRNKATYHLLDALRYVCSEVHGGSDYDIPIIKL